MYSYYSYNAMALPLVLAVLLLWNIRCFKRRKLVYAVSLGLLLVNMVYYIARMTVFRDLMAGI